MRIDTFSLWIADLAGVHLVCAEHGARHFRPARAHQPGKTQDLALAHDEVHVLDEAPAIQVAHLEYDLVVRGRGGRAVALEQGAADHHCDDGLHAGGRGRHRVDVLAVAHHGYAVGDSLELVHLVRDVDDADPVAFELADDAEEVIDFRVVQRRGGLIHDEHPGFERQGLGDFHHLLLGHGEFADQGVRIQVQMQAVEDLPSVLLHFPIVDEQAEAPAGFAADEDVLRDAAVVHQVELLMNDADAEILRGSRARDIHRLAVDANLARVLLVHARQHFHQRGLAGAILAHQRVHFASHQLEPAVVERAHARKRFAEILDRDKRNHGPASRTVNR